jgi:hypothetical protein
VAAGNWGAAVAGPMLASLVSGIEASSFMPVVKQVLARQCRKCSQRMLQVSYMNSMLRRIFVAALPLVAVALASTARAQGNPPATTSAALFQNVRIFDGKGASLSAPSNVLIKGNIIERISTEPVAAEPGATIIAGNGRTLMPGLIDAHWHAMLIRPNPAQAIVGMLDTTISRPASRRPTH